VDTRGAHTALTCDDVLWRTDVDGSEGFSKLAMPVRSRSPAPPVTAPPSRRCLHLSAAPDMSHPATDTSPSFARPEQGCRRADGARFGDDRAMSS